jgi:hypothetical protein
MATIRGAVGRGGRNFEDDVRVIQELLNSHTHLIQSVGVLDADGDIGWKTITAITEFQRRVVGMRSPDGRVDPGGRTLARLNGETTDDSDSETTPGYYYPAGPQAPLIEIARPYLGAREARGNRMGNDPRMREIFESDWLSPGGVTDSYAWCCSFVSMCVQKLIRQHNIYAHVRPPRTASVSGFRTRWAPSQNCLIFQPNNQQHRPCRGDVVVYKFSHIGIVDTASSRGVTTIEGNTNEAGSREGTSVMNKTRAYAIIRCFIRLPVPTSYDFENQVCVG